MTEAYQKVRPKDHAVLTCIRDGDDDVRAIRETTALTLREINYAVKKLEDAGLIAVQRPDGYQTEIIDGQKRTFQAPKNAALTDTGTDYFDWTERDGDLAEYAALDDEELVRTVRSQDERIDALETAFDAFRRQVMQKLEAGDD